MCQRSSCAEKCCVIACRFHFSIEVLHFAAKLKLNTKSCNTSDFLIQYLPRQTIFWNTVSHHASGSFSTFDYMHSMTKATQLIRGRKSRRPRPHNQNALAGICCRNRQLPIFFEGVVSQESLNRINADGFIDSITITRTLTGVIANTPHNGRKWIVLNNLFPSVLIIAALSMKQPSLTQLSCRTFSIAGR